MHVANAAANRATGTPLTKDTEQKIIIINRSGRSIDPEEESAQTGGAASSIWDLAFSKGSGAEVSGCGDGANEKVHILDRQTLEVLTSFGDGGRQPGQFYGVHSIAMDSKVNIFTTETYRGQRVQKCVYKGLGPITTLDQGVYGLLKPGEAAVSSAG